MLSCFILVRSNPPPHDTTPDKKGKKAPPAPALPAVTQEQFNSTVVRYCRCIVKNFVEKIVFTKSWTIVRTWSRS